MALGSKNSRFRAFGGNADVEKVYREVYASQSFDGGKVATFYEVWRDEDFGLNPTEVDHGFFVDRSAHMTVRGLRPPRGPGILESRER